MFESREAEKAFCLFVWEILIGAFCGAIVGLICFYSGLKVYWVIMGFKFYWAAFLTGLVIAIVVFIYNFIRDTDKIGNTAVIVTKKDGEIK